MIKPTNWEKYYSKRKNNNFKISSITRKISSNIILNLLKKYKNIDSICEFGGGDSCFYKAFRNFFSNANYIVFDSSKNGVDSFNNKYFNEPPYKQKATLLNLFEDKNLEAKFDIVFSVGLIEHFDVENTKVMCIKHFKVVKSGGIVLISYPTPTFFYKFIRNILEKINLWEFHDERALYFDEVDSVCKDYGSLIYRKLNFAIGLTQEILVYKKY